MKTTTKKQHMEINLLQLLDKLNDYPASQNVRPKWALSKDKSEVLYYRMWSDKTPEKRLSIDLASKCNDCASLQKLIGI